MCSVLFLSVSCFEQSLHGLQQGVYAALRELVFLRKTRRDKLLVTATKTVITDYTPTLLTLSEYCHTLGDGEDQAPFLNSVWNSSLSLIKHQ